jgi:hypothetical protein
MVIIVLGLLLVVAAAADTAEPSWVQRWLEQPTLTGNWFGLRDRLGEWGITRPSRTARTC